MLESRNVTKKYGGKTALDGVSITCEPGHIYAMLGPNGSGKTTWMKLAAGLLKPDAGGMLLDGAPMGVDSRRRIAYMSTEPYFYAWMKAGDVGRYYGDFFEDYSADRFRALLERMELSENLKTRELSSGMMAKLKIAVTLARDAEVCMLDEPFNGIDLLARDAIRESILDHQTEKRVLLISSHLVEEMEALSDRYIFLKNGVLVEQGDVEEMREVRGVSMADRYREVYGHQEVSHA